MMRSLVGLVLLAVTACGSPRATDPVPVAPAATPQAARAAERGTGVPRDFERAATIYAALCDDGRGALDACFALVDAIEEARGTAYDRQREIGLDNMLCRRGDSVACVSSILLRDVDAPVRQRPLGAGEPPDDTQIAELKRQLGRVKDACERGDGRACELVASESGGDGSTAQYERRKMYGVACRAGRFQSCWQIAYDLEMCDAADDVAACEARQVAAWRANEYDADRIAAATSLTDACHAGDARACDGLPNRRIPLAALCAAHDYRACGELGCIGDDAAGAVALAHGVDQPNCHVARNKARLEWERTPAGPGRARFAPLEIGYHERIGARPTKPFEAVRFVHHGGRDRHDWPRYDVYNLSDRTVAEVAVCLYAYATPNEASFTQLARFTTTARVVVPPDAFVELRLDGANEPALPDGTDAVLIDYDHVRFEGETSGTDDHARCPERRPYERSSAPWSY